MSVYIELVIFNNIAIDLFLSLATVSMKRRKPKFWRIAASCVLGAACATVYGVASAPVRLAIRLLLAPVMALVLTKPEGNSPLKKAGDFLGTLFIFVMFTFFVGGAVYGLSNLLKVDLTNYAVLGLMALALCAMTLLVRTLVAAHSAPKKRRIEAVVATGGVEAKLSGLADSGNLLVDDFTGLPVVMLSLEAEKMLKVGGAEGSIQVQTVGGECAMGLVRLEVDIDGKRCQAMGALTHKSLGDYDMILQYSMF